MVSVSCSVCNTKGPEISTNYENRWVWWEVVCACCGFAYRFHRDEGLEFPVLIRYDMSVLSFRLNNEFIKQKLDNYEGGD